MTIPMARGLALALLVALVPVLGCAEQPAPQPSAAPASLKPGDLVPAFDAEAVAGGQQRVDFKETTVLLFFLSGCPHCHRQIPEWNRAYARRGTNVRVLGVIMDHEPPGFFTVTQVDFPVLRAPAGDFSKTFKISRVPTTLRVGPGGKVEDVNVGNADPIRLGGLFRR